MAKGDIAAMTKTHCIGYQDMDSGEEFYFGPAVPYDHPVWDKPHSESERRLLANPTDILVDQGVRFAEEASLLIFHNGINFDYRAMEKFHGFKRPKKSWDSFILAKLVWPGEVLLGPDLVRGREGKFPMNLLKSHSLKAWGYRLGDNKEEYVGDFDKYPEDGDPETKARRYAERWQEWNPYMASYMMQDNRPMVKLFKLVEKRMGWVEPEKADLVWPESVIEYEHEAAHIIAEQEDFGVRFDVEAGRKLETMLDNMKASHDRDLKATFGSWWQGGDQVTPKAERAMARNDLPSITQRRISPKTGKELAPYVGPPVERYAPDAPYTPIERLTFNPSSRVHLGMRLMDLFGWAPKKFGKGKDGAQGNPTVDESVLEEIPEAVLPKDVRKLILNYFIVNKTLGMLSGGRAAWLNLVDKTGRLHGRVDTNGAVTRRATHSSPNLGQCPAIIKAKVLQPDGTTKEVILYLLEGRFGYECRALFIADEGWELTGVDASALELIDLGHYLVPYDEGAFRDRVCDPKRDPHTEHAQLTGLTRGDTKTATYLYIYGGSAYKLSLDIDIADDEIAGNLGYRGLGAMLRSLVKRFDQDFVDHLDDRQLAKIVKARKIILSFEDGITGIKDLKANVTAAAAKGWLRGMDGSRLHVRKSHAALNTLLQSAGAMSCKLWMVLFHRRMKALGYVHGVDYKQVLWVHDELQLTHRPGLGPIIKEQANIALREAGEQLNLRGVYRTDGHTGNNWAETH